MNSKPKAPDWWKELADLHAITPIKPSLVTGRCRCDACREALHAGYRPPLHPHPETPNAVS